MVIFVDTSATYALLDADDPNHRLANDALRRHLDDRFVTHNYVVLESIALIQRRLGLRFVRAFTDRLLPLLDVEWVDRPRHERAVADLVASRRRRVSLVDRISFDVMRENEIRTAFTFDRDFAREGFTVLD